MSRIFALILIAGLSVGSGSLSFAADMPVKAPIAPPLYNWTGLYIGINGGGGWGQETVGDNPFGGCPPCTTEHHKPDGGVFGGQLGYRWQMNQFVFGVEGTGDWANLSSTIVLVPGLESETFKVRSLYTVTGQIGWTMDRWLAYAKGGWAGATTDYSLDATVATAGQSQNANGWTVGVGVDYAVWQNWIFGLEYGHFDLGYGGFTAPASNGGAPFIVTNTSRLTIDQVVARLSYKFDWH